MTSWDRINASLGSVPGLPIAAGILPQADTIRKFGRNLDIDTGSLPETIWTGGGVYPWPQDPEEPVWDLEIVSDSTSDREGASGGRLTELTGLDENWLEKKVEIFLNGTTPVALPGQWRRFHRARVLEAGSNGSNVGTITIREESTLVTYGEILPDQGSTEMAIFTIPADKEGYFLEVRSGVVRSSGAPLATVSLFIRDNRILRPAWALASEFSAGSTSAPAIPRYLPPLTDIDARVSFVSDNNVSVTFEFDLFLVPTQE